MDIFKCRASKIRGTSYREVRRKAYALYLSLKRRTKRKPYVRSAYFLSEKIFLDLFWSHLFEKKNFADQMRRLKFYPCAIELIEKSKFKPISKVNVDRSSEILHRFQGQALNGECFFVQIKENLNSGRKDLLSIFPSKK